jgi:hypothetical protein
MASQRRRVIANVTIGHKARVLVVSSQGAETASASFMVPARRRHGTYVCPDAPQVIRPKPEAAGPAGSVAANLGIVDSKRGK